MLGDGDAAGLVDGDGIALALPLGVGDGVVLGFGFRDGVELGVVFGIALEVGLGLDNGDGVRLGIGDGVALDDAIADGDESGLGEGDGSSGSEMHMDASPLDAGMNEHAAREPTGGRLAESVNLQEAQALFSQRSVPRQSHRWAVAWQLSTRHMALSGAPDENRPQTPEAVVGRQLQ